MWEKNRLEYLKPLQSTSAMPSKLAFEVNCRAGYGISEIGVGREGLATFCGIMGMPPPSEPTAWHAQIKSINNAANSEFEKEAKRAAVRLRKVLKNETEALEQLDPENFSQVVNVAVSFDGTWHHRGFKSFHGVGVVMSVDTGDVLDVAILSKDCSICLNNKNADEDWKDQHAKSGKREKNCDGPSTSMETQAARTLWQRSEKRGLRYTTVLSDGDNKTLSALNELKPYKNVSQIEKIDCVNLVHKRMGAGLRSLLKGSKEVKGGKGGLTFTMENTTTSKNLSEIETSVQNMQKRILANLHHSVYHPDPNIQNKYCEVTWCPFIKDKETGSTSYSHDESKKKRLPQSFLPHLLPLYERLSDKHLLTSCVGGLTQNQNEGFNATIWRKCPKERYFGAAAVKRAVHLAVVSWNSGRSSYEQILNALGIDSNCFIVKLIQARDCKRLSQSIKYVEQKENRKRLVKEKNQTEMAKKRQYGDDYQPGQC